MCFDGDGEELSLETSTKEPCAEGGLLKDGNCVVGTGAGWCAESDDEALSEMGNWNRRLLVPAPLPPGVPAPFLLDKSMPAMSLCACALKLGLVFEDWGSAARCDSGCTTGPADFWC